MTLVAQPWNNPGHGRAAGVAIQRTLEDGCLGPPSGVRRAGYRHCGPHRDVVGIHAVGSGRRGNHLARRRNRHVGGVLPVPTRASRATTWVLVDAVHAHPRHGPRPVVGPGVLTAPPFAAASAVRQSPVLSTRPGCAGTERLRRAGRECPVQARGHCQSVPSVEPGGARQEVRERERSVTGARLASSFQATFAGSPWHGRAGGCDGDTGPPYGRPLRGVGDHTTTQPPNGHKGKVEP